MGKFFSDTSVYLIANILNLAVPFALLPVLTRYLTPKEYGEVAMYQVLLIGFGSIVGLSVHGAASVKYYDNDIDDREMGKFIFCCFQILALTTLILFALVFLAKNHLAAWLSIPAEWTLWAVLVCSMNIIAQMRLNQWQVRKCTLRYAFFQVFSSILNGATSLLFVVTFLRGAQGRVEGQNIAFLFSGLAALLWLSRDGLLRWTWKPVYLREVLRFGAPLIPHVLGLFLLGTADRLVVGILSGLDQAGIYMVAVQIALAMSIFFMAVNNAYVPWLFERLKRNDNEEKLQVIRFTHLFFLLSLASAGIAFLSGPFVIPLIAGAEFASASNVFGWLALGQALSGMYLLVTNYILFSKRTAILSAITLSTSLVLLVSLFVLTSHFGIQGAAISFATAMGIRFLLTWWIAAKIYPMPWFQTALISRR